VTEPAGVETTDAAGPGVVYQGVIALEWPAPRPIRGGVHPLPGWQIGVFDALNGRQITTVTRIELHASAVDMVSADVTMFADLDDQPVYDGKPHERDGETIWGTFPFLVAEMRVRQPAPDRAALDPKFAAPDMREPAEA
jgi:hypothetical protein